MHRRLRRVVSYGGAGWRSRPVSLFILYDGFELGAMWDMSYMQTIIEPSMLQKKNAHRGEKRTLRWGKLSPPPNQEITGSVPPVSVPPVSLVDIMDPTGCRERDTSPLWSSPKLTAPVKHEKILDKTLNLGVMRNKKRWWHCHRPAETKEPYKGNAM